MRTRKKTPAGLARLTAAALTIPLAVVALADDNEWVYDTSKRVEIPPTTAEKTMNGLDAKSRGLLATAGNATVDKWYWTIDSSNACSVDFTPPGGMIIIR